MYSKRVYELSKTSENDELDGSLSYLNAKEKEFLAFLLKNDYMSLHQLKYGSHITDADGDVEAFPRY